MSDGFPLPSVEHIYDTRTCPRCGGQTLRYAGRFADEYDPDGRRWACSACDRWCSVIELKRKNGGRVAFQEEVRAGIDRGFHARTGTFNEIVSGESSKEEY